MTKTQRTFNKNSQQLKSEFDFKDTLYIKIIQEKN